MKRSTTKTRKPVDDSATFDPGAQLCGHGDRTRRAHYLGGGLWVCFECLAKLMLGNRYTPPHKEIP